MTLAELKRNANSGKMKLEIVERYGKTEDDIIERLRGVRKVLRANSVALILQNLSGEESELRIPSAKLIEYDGNFLTVYAVGERDMTEQEKAVLGEWQRIEKEFYENNPYGEAYWKQVSYFKKCSCPWMSGFDTVNGKKYQYNGKVRDNQVRGAVILKYKVYME